MPRYVIERTFPDGLRIPMNQEGASACGSVIEKNAKVGVTWIHSYVSEDLRKSFCIYDGPSVQSVRDAAAANNLPIDKVVSVNVLNPYFYMS